LLRRCSPHLLPSQTTAEFEAHNLARPGDVLVVDGVPGVSNLGGISTQTGKRQGEAGAIVFGGVGDIAHSRSVGYPVWSSEVTPLTGKGHIETVEINGEVEVTGVRVAPGDIVLADDSGVCFIPRARGGVAGTGSQEGGRGSGQVQGDRRGHAGRRSARQRLIGRGRQLETNCRPSRQYARRAGDRARGRRRSPAIVPEARRPQVRPRRPLRASPKSC
jgi:hypothetical protein